MGIATLEEVVLELQTGPFGSALHKSDYQANGTPVVNPASIHGGRIVPIDSMAVGAEALERLAGFRLRAGDIVMARRGEMGRCALVTDDAAGWLCGTGSVVLRMPRALYGRYFALLLGSPYVKRHLEGSAVGTTMLNLNQRILLGLVVGVPPLLEQRRIVAKVSELMALSDRLEAARAERESTRGRLTISSLNRLSVSDLGKFRNASELALNALPTLTARADQIAQLRQTILNLAVRGKLAAQDSSEESAQELVQRISAAKSRLVAEAGFSSLDEREKTERHEEPFPIPASWQWRRLDDLAGVARGGSPRPIQGFITNDEQGTPWIKIGDATRGDIYINSTAERIRPEGVARSRLVEPGDLLLSNSMSFGFPYITNVRGCIHDGWLVIRTPSELMEKLYLRLVFLSDFARDAFARAAAGAVVQNLNADKVRRLLVPVPPLLEQRRIVAKVAEVMELCDRLEASLRDANDTRARLLEALLAGALRPELH